MSLVCPHCKHEVVLENVLRKGSTKTRIKNLEYLGKVFIIPEQHSDINIDDLPILVKTYNALNEYAEKYKYKKTLGCIHGENICSLMENEKRFSKSVIRELEQIISELN